MHFPKKKKPFLQLVFLVVSVVVLYGSLVFGFQNSETGGNESSTMMLAQEYIKQENYDQAYTILTKYVENSSKVSAEVYFALSFIEIKRGLLDDAKSHLLKVINLDSELPEAYYNLALIYLEENDLLNARENAEKAAELKPSQQEYADLVQELNRLLPPSRVRRELRFRKCPISVGKNTLEGGRGIRYTFIVWLTFLCKRAK